MISQREAERWGIPGFVGTSPLIKNVLRDIQLLQNSNSTSVLVTGESGTGKELVARALHFGSGRAQGPFVPVNCSAVPAELAESQFFGHAKGAFTGANTDRKGHFQLAHGGTLFLDEIGDMPLDLQAKLLRVLEDGVVVPVGADQGQPVDVRVVSATNADLQASVEAGTFRQDLYFRLAAFPVSVPPLRQRPEDIPLLVDHFVALLAGEMGFQRTTPDAAAVTQLQSYPFPGNIRELKNIVERALLESAGGEIRVEHLHIVRPSASQSSSVASESKIAPTPQAEHLPLNLVEAEKVLIRRALEETEGNIAAAARLLGTNRPRLYRFLQEEEETVE
jgi:transcriptional regulator with GAF, ATPase, and Fis domain